MKQFGYVYLQGTNLLHKLTKPNGMMLTQSYETQRDLITGIAYHSLPPFAVTYSERRQ